MHAFIYLVGQSQLIAHELVVLEGPLVLIDDPRRTKRIRGLHDVTLVHVMAMRSACACVPVMEL